MVERGGDISDMFINTLGRRGLGSTALKFNMHTEELPYFVTGAALYLSKILSFKVPMLHFQGIPLSTYHPSKVTWDLDSEFYFSSGLCAENMVDQKITIPEN